MSRFTYAAGLGLATLLVVPTVADGGSAPNSLEEALRRTIAALEHLAGVEQRLRERDPHAIELARLATEAPLTAPTDDPGWRDARLEELRHEVTHLQGRLERDSAATSRTAAPAAIELPKLAPPTTGLDDETRDALAASIVARSGGEQATRASGKKEDTAKQVLEDETYTADSMRLAQAYFRRGDFERARALFALKAEDDLDASYWLARCLEQLGRVDEAITGLERVVARGGSNWTAVRAAEDLDFLRWRVSLEKDAAPRGTKKP